MMMCRVLCALLVLALCCCCPSVCVAEAMRKGSSNTATKNTKPESTRPESPEAAPSLSLPLPGLPSKEPVVEIEESVGGGEILTVQEPTTVTENTKEVKNGTTGPISGNNIPTEQTNKKSEASAQTTTTTTTTKAPTTTTTTTTTHPPSTTTTEAPTTTTTRAPSRLREIDGSLSSSAWVCAPLLLAASALAYTALG
ncbi:putative mucin TcMUCII [Trypanosoma cruzi]|uniref:Mucin TcMUCII, putative n=2 Tax=Trypanosoma cruzi TaxID=5693 RepID=Q4CKN4_TRYCC|nr:mucin TcMUCII, putative [Trypanosoma cruzi]EAN80836.1 mucin TcMUCII, putative [Trypanosoma cruzi]PWV14090.1 putative mucin TcMUCII [Trypanosoma cruzi]|eukprot:XP_802282.1 mucin TcMUCII [Trypanosoma cruzi strain CL Brener]